MNTRPVVVGAGWAGLACATALARAGHPPLLLEAARQAGGRARRANLAGRPVDNGQHLLIGAYGETLKAMEQVGVNLEAAFTRRPLTLSAPDFSLGLPPWPAPWHLAAGLLGCRGVPYGEKLAAAWTMTRLRLAGWRPGGPGQEGLTVAQWLDQTGSRGKLRSRLWEPLCYAALNTPPETASMAVFATVLKDSLGGRGNATDLLLPRRDFSALYPDPALADLGRRGGEFQPTTRVTALRRQDQRWLLSLQQGSERRELLAGQVVLALPDWATRRLLPPDLVQSRKDLGPFAHEPIATCYLDYGRADARLPEPLMQVDGPTATDAPVWVFDRSLVGQPGLLGVVISARGPWQDLTGEALAEAMAQGLARAFPALATAPPRWHGIIQEQRATLSCTPGLIRPTRAEIAPGLHLAGDWTWASYPSTLEGAVRSGHRAARAVLASQP